MVNIRNFTNRDEFTKFFSLNNFKKLPLEQRAKHTLLGCVQCSRDPALIAAFKLKKGNAQFVIEPQTPVSVDPLRQANENTPDDSSSCPRKKRKVHDKEGVASSVKYAILKEERDFQKERQKLDDFAAVFSGNMSLLEYSKFRRRKYVDNRPTRPRTHVGVLANYRYNRTVLLLELYEIEANPLKTVNYHQLSREIELKNARGMWPRNGGQVSCCCYNIHLLLFQIISAHIVADSQVLVLLPLSLLPTKQIQYNTLNDSVKFQQIS